MKRKLFIAPLTVLLAAGISGTAYADTTASQTVTGTLNPYVKVTNGVGTSTAVTINDDGSLSANMTPSFKFVSNNKNGATATFSIKVNTSDNNQTDAILGTANSSTGRIVLANTASLPTSNAVKDALSDSPANANNPNAISYQMTFNSDNSTNGRTPAFSQDGSIAGGSVLTKNGANSVTITIDKNSVRTGTYSEDDESGSYQAVIYCTSAIL